MITIARYNNMTEAQEDAARLAKRDIRVSLVHGGTGFTIAGVDSAIELQVDPRDMEKLKELQEEVSEEIVAERKYECPNCLSKNYTTREFMIDAMTHRSIMDVLTGMLRVIVGGRPRLDDDRLQLHCRDCNYDFESSE